jgi:L-lactate dehydrogenase (cytochrome)
MDSRSLDGPIVVKGILTGDDASRAIDHVQPPWWSQIAADATVKGREEVLTDGGIRRGDIVKAVCLGARAVLIGRAYAYGLATAGESGITRAIQILKDDVKRTLRLLGCRSIKDLNSSYVDATWFRNSYFPE